MDQVAVPSVALYPCRCKNRHTGTPSSQRHCMECGGRNPGFTMEAFKADFGDVPFGQDCRNDHVELRETVKEYPDSPYCEHCGFLAPVAKSPARKTNKAPT